MGMTWAAARVNAGLTQVETCKKIGIGLNTLIDWEKYRKYPNVVYAEKLCNLYGCELSDISIESSANNAFTGESDGKVS